MNRLPAHTLAARIMDGTLPASAALRRPDAYDALTTGANGRLPLLGSSAKIDAGMGVGVLSAVLYMMPANFSGRESCPFRSDGCTAACLAEGTGRMSMTGPQRARRRRHGAFFADRARFLADLHREIAAHERKAQRAGKVAAIRLNGTTDLPWHRMGVTVDGVSYPNLHAAFPNVHFYEYTKRPLMDDLPANLSITYSVSDRSDSDGTAQDWLDAGHNAAVVTTAPRHDPPATFTINGVSYPTVDGDAHDARFMDPSAHVVILAAKGRAKHDTTGFVRQAG